MSKILEQAKAGVQEKTKEEKAGKGKTYTQAQIEASMAFSKLQDLKDKLGEHSEWSLNDVTLQDLERSQRLRKNVLDYSAKMHLVQIKNPPKSFEKEFETEKKKSVEQS